MTEDDDDLVAIGAVIKPHGLKGEVRVHPFNEASKIWSRLEEVVLVGPGDEAPRRVRVLRGRRAVKHAILSLEGVEGRLAAEELRGLEVRVPRSILPPVADDEFYFVDLIGAAAVDADGAKVGEVEDVLEYPSVVCLAIRFEDGRREVPLLPRWIPSLDVDAGEVRVEAIDELPLVP